MAKTHKVRKSNRVLNVGEDSVASYLAQGYDEIGENGKVITRATGGRSVSISEYNAVLDQLDEAHAEQDQDLKKENAALKGKVTRLEKELAETKK